MRIRLAQALILLTICPAIQPVARSQVPTIESLAGEWQLTTVEMGIPYSERLPLTDSGADISGSVGGDKSIKGKRERCDVRLEFKRGSEDYAYVGKVTKWECRAPIALTG